MAEQWSTPAPARWSSRRNVLRAAGVAGVGIAAAALASGHRIGLSSARSGGPDDPRFTIAVIPDTQFLFDADRGDPEPLAASLAYLMDRREADNIVFVAHLGDIVENAAAAELRAAGNVFRSFDAVRMPYSVVAGNHDIDSRTDDRRGSSAYLDVFGPHRFTSLPSFGGASPDGYNTYHLFAAAGRRWLLLALDWRPSAGTLDWARGVLHRHRQCPAILTTHELVAPNLDGTVTLPAHGQRLWDELIRDHDQIFLAVNGHFWPAGRTVLRNAAGNDVHLHVTNYQNRYYGGSGMIRLYRFDTARNTIDVRTLSPWIMSMPPGRRSHLAAREIELTDPQNAFSVPVDFAARFAGFTPTPARPGAARAGGVVAHWRFDGGRPITAGPVEDLSGHGNHLTPVDLPGGRCLATAADAPLNRARFAGGYTIEAYLRLPADALARRTRAGLLSRLGTGADASRSAGDAADPLAALEIADGLALRWSARPMHRDAVSVNWSHELPVGRWSALAVVNDGNVTTMYVDGEPVLRNPRTPAIGLATTGRPWLVGASHHGGVLRWPLVEGLTEVRLADRPLSPAQFLGRG